MNAFGWAEPKSVEQALALLASSGPKAAVMSGGTDLLGLLKEGLTSPEVVIDLGSIPGLSYIKRDTAGLAVGPLTTIAELAADPMIEKDYPGLHQAASVIASPQLRNIGTVGGNLCQRPRCWYFRNSEIFCRKKGGGLCYAYRGRNKYHAVFGGGPCYIVYPSDLAPMLMALGAAVSIASPRGDRLLPLGEFYAPPATNVRRENVLAPDELVREVRLPAPGQRGRSAYVKLEERQTWDFALVSCAVSASVAGGSPSGLRIVMGGVAPVPWRMGKVEAALDGRRPTEASIEAAVRTGLADAKPLAENGYKGPLIEAAISRALLGLI